MYPRPQSGASTIQRFPVAARGTVRAPASEPPAVSSSERSSYYYMLHATVLLYKVRLLRAAARCIPERGGGGHMTVFEKRAVHGYQ